MQHTHLPPLRPVPVKADAAPGSLDHLLALAEMKAPDVIAAFNEKDAEGRTIIHRLAAEGDLVKLHLAYKQLVRHKLEHLLNQRDKYGQTALHYGVLSGKKAFVKELLAFLKDKAPDATKTVNSRNRIPFELTQNKEIQDLLKPYMKQHNLRPLKEHIDLKTLLERYRKEIKDMPQLKRILTAACIAHNKARDAIAYSNTHPRCFDEKKDSSSDKTFINEIRTAEKKEFLELKAKFDRKSQRLAAEEVTTKSIQKEIKLEKSLSRAVWDFNHNLIKLLPVGNCHEYSLLTIKFFQKQCPDVAAKLVHIVNGDHVFVLINPNPLCSLDDFKTFGNACVVCDSWSGEIFLASELPQKLKNYSSIHETPQKTLRQIGPFVKEHHFLGEKDSSKPRLEVFLSLTTAQRKAYLQLTDVTGRNNWHHILLNESYSAIRMFLKMMANLNDPALIRDLFLARDNFNRNALHYAFFSDSPKIIQLLLNEYMKTMSAEVPAMLLIDNLKFITELYNRKKEVSIKAILDFFKNDDKALTSINAHLASLRTPDPEPPAPGLKVSLFKTVPQLSATPQKTAKVTPAPNTLPVLKL